MNKRMPRAEKAAPLILTDELFEKQMAHALEYRAIGGKWMAQHYLQTQFINQVTACGGKIIG